VRADPTSYLPPLRIGSAADTPSARAGIPPTGTGQNYYTLRSVFLAGVAPPAIHMHIRRYDVRADVPIGTVARVPDASDAQPELEVPPGDAQAFELWLRELWRQKDRLVERFHARGTFAADDAEDARAVDVPVRLRSAREVLGAYCFFVPAVLGYLSAKVRGALS
jgi:hypothetical protein